jgi:glycosyltransferase involved in cell wall biosynthesis
MSLNILFLSHAFAPAIGGIEASSELLADAFVKKGHRVRLMTMTTGEAPGLPYEVIRNPTFAEKMKHHAWADVVYENNPCVRLGWPKLLFGKPSVVVLQTWVSRLDGTVATIDKMKFRWLAKADKVIAISEAVRHRCWSGATIIGNSYDNKLFGLRPVQRKKDFVFLGRLVSDKGAELALRAFNDLISVNPLAELADATLTVIGSGPDLESLKQLAQEFAEPDRIRFIGPLKGEVLVTELNKHSFQFIPSVWEEPFGIVALEGIACGLIPIVSDGGGLPDATGKAGVTFKRGQLNSLIEVTAELVRSNELQEKCLQAAPHHLSQFATETITAKFIAVLESAAAKRGIK